MGDSEARELVDESRTSNAVVRRISVVFDLELEVCRPSSSEE